MAIYNAEVKGAIKTDPWFRHIQPGSYGGGRQSQGGATKYPKPDDIEGLAYQSALLKAEQGGISEEGVQNQSYNLLKYKHNGNVQAWAADPALKEIYTNLRGSQQNYEYNTSMSKSNKASYDADKTDRVTKGTDDQYYLVEDDNGRFHGTINPKTGKLITAKEYANIQNQNLGYSENGLLAEYTPTNTVKYGTLNSELSATITEAKSGSLGSYSKTSPVGSGKYGLNVQDLGNGEMAVYYGEQTGALKTDYRNILGGTTNIHGEKVTNAGVGEVLYKKLTPLGRKEAKDKFLKEFYGKAVKGSTTRDNEKLQGAFMEYVQYYSEKNPDLDEETIAKEAEESVFKEWLTNYATEVAKNTISYEPSSDTKYKYSSDLSKMNGSGADDADGLAFFASVVAEKREPSGSNEVLVMDKNGRGYYADYSVNGESLYNVWGGSPLDVGDINSSIHGHMTGGNKTTVGDMFPGKDYGFTKTTMPFPLSSLNNAVVLQVMTDPRDQLTPARNKQTGDYMPNYGDVVTGKANTMSLEQRRATIKELYAQYDDWSKSPTVNPNEKYLDLPDLEYKPINLVVDKKQEIANKELKKELDAFANRRGDEPRRFVQEEGQKYSINEVKKYLAEAYDKEGPINPFNNAAYGDPLPVEDNIETGSVSKVKTVGIKVFIPNDMADDFKDNLYVQDKQGKVVKGWSKRGDVEKDIFEDGDEYTKEYSDILPNGVVTTIYVPMDIYMAMSIDDQTFDKTAANVGWEIATQAENRKAGKSAGIYQSSYVKTK